MELLYPHTPILRAVLETQQVRRHHEEFLMRYRKMDENRDMIFGNQQLDFLRDVPEAIGQSVETRVLLFLGEWFLDLDEGTPYFQGILGKKNKELADASLKARVASTEGVTRINNYQSEVDPVTRKMSVSMDIDTIYGPSLVKIASYTDY
jgi:hypothetical protein